MSTFSGAGGRESPAGAALSLVLDVGDVSLGSPVNGVGVGLGGIGWHGRAVRVSLGAVSESVVLNPFLIGEIGPLVHLDGEGLLTGEGSDVVLDDELSRDEPVLEASHFVAFRLVGLANGSLPFLELLEVLVVEGEGRGGDGEGSEQLHLDRKLDL